MLFNIAPTNAERVKKEFTATRPEHAHGYFKSVILTSENRFYTYRIDMICGYYILTVRTRNKEQLEIIATFEEYKPGSIAATKGELYKNGSGYPYRIEKSERYLKKYDQLACIVHGAIAAGLLFDMLKDEPTPAPLPEESTPATSPEANQDTTTGAQDGPTAPESNTAGENTTGADKAPEEATQRRRQAFIVECRSPRGDWKRYSDEQPTHEAAERIKEQAENRHALTPDGAPIFYRIVQIDKGPEQIMTPQEGPTTAGTTAANETTTTAETAPQEATSDAGTAADNSGTTAAEKAPERPATSTPAQDTTGSDTRPPRAQEANQEPGHAAGDHTEPAADHITGPTTGNTSGTAAGAITGRTTPKPQNPGHACENAPGRTETPQAVPTTTPPHKRPHRGKTRAGPPAAGSQATPPEVRFSGSMTKTVPKTGPPNRKPFCSTIFRFFDPVLAGPEKRSDPRGYQNLLQ